MSALDQALAHFQSIPRQSLHVPEWELIVWWTPLTLWEKRQIFPPDVSPTELLPADVLIRKAESEDGKKLFTIDDRERLMRSVDQSVCTRIATAIMKPVTGSVDAAEKN